MALGLMHDAAEAATGDLTPRDGVSKEEKNRREELVLEDLNARAPQLGVLELWREYSEGSTPEAAIVNDANLLDMVIQALIYERDGATRSSLEEFWTSARNRLRTDTGRSVYQHLERWRRRTQ